jgi:hypothetical protein
VNIEFYILGFWDSGILGFWDSGIFVWSPECNYSSRLKKSGIRGDKRINGIMIRIE